MGVDARGAPSGTITFLLTDVEGSSRLWEVSPTDAAAALARHREVLTAAIEARGGFLPLEQGEGDSVVAAFERASDAVRSACEAQTALADEPWPGETTLRVRMALHSGEVTAAPDGTYAGAVLNRCARLRALAHGGQVVISQTTRDLVVDEIGDVLVQDLGTHRLRDLSRPEHIWQVTTPGRTDSFPPLRSLDASPNNLPIELSSFVGRDEDVALGAKLLGDTRLLTLTGSGGCGKTRLALRVAAEASGSFDDGVWWVALAPLSDGALVPSALAGAMNVRLPPERSPVDAVFGHLADRSALVVLDNCEHLLDTLASFVDGLRRAAPATKVLATSREPLTVEGEVTWRVPSLAIPPRASHEPEMLGQYDAVRLFIERAVQVRPNFSVDNENAPAVAEICARLDGIPLAIELAAARSRMLTPERIAAELDDRFRLLTGGSRTSLPRHQTLLASVDWSHDRLAADERAVFRRIGVFAGGFTLDAAEAVASSNDLDRYDVLDVLARLVNKSLVQLQDPENSRTSERYLLLETIREYANARLDEAGEVSSTRDRHLDWAVQLSEALASDATEADAPSVRQLGVERPNLNAALEWAVARSRIDDMLRVVSALGFYWTHVGQYTVARRWTTVVEERGREGDPRLLARARCAIAYSGLVDGTDIPAVRSLSEDVLTAARDLDDRSTEARSLMNLGNTFLVEDPALCRLHVAEAASIAHEVGDEFCEVHSLQLAAYAYINEGRPEDAERALVRHSEVAAELGSDVQRAWWHGGLGLAALLRGDLGLAETELGKGFELALRVGDPLIVMVTASALAYHALAAGQPDRARAVADTMTSEDREWGLRGDVLISTIDATARLLEAPAEALATASAVGQALFAMKDHSTGGVVLMLAVVAALEIDDLENAERLAQLGLEVARPTGLAAAGLLASAMARIAMARGDPSAAEEYAHEALAFMAERGMRVFIADTLDVLGRAAIRDESFGSGTRLIAAADEFRTTIGQRRLPSAQREVEVSLGQARAGLAESFDDVWNEGATLPIDEAISYAQRARGERKRPSFGWDSLTPTELEVVRHVANGLTNPAIGERMFITSGTVKTHLRHIFGKLGIGNRSALAAEASRRESPSR